MRIYLMRHGYAGEHLGLEERDPANLNRSLKPEGEEQVAALAQWMIKQNETPNVIYSSPIKRAMQTAKIVSDELGIAFHVAQPLEISKPMEMFIKKIAADSSIKRPLLVAHHDNILPALRHLNFVSAPYVDPMAMSELRALKVDRDTAEWKERFRKLPSDLGFSTDYY